MSYLASVTGLDSKGTVARTLVAIDGQPQGIFRLAAAKPLTAADLSPIPRDATIAAAGRFDADAALELLLAQLEKIDPAARKDVTRGIDEMEKELGIDLQAGLCSSRWATCGASTTRPAEGGLLVTGLTGVVQVKDHDRLEATLNKLMTLFHDRVEATRGAGRLRQSFAAHAADRKDRLCRTGHLPLRHSRPAISSWPPPGA